MQHAAVIITPGNQALVMKAGVYLKWHDRDLFLRIISRRDEHVQSLVAPRRFLINHLVGVSIEAIGMIFESAKESRIKIPLGESNSNMIMPRHSLHHECG